MGRDFFKNLLNVFPDPQDSVWKMQTMKPGFVVCGYDGFNVTKDEKIEKKERF